MCNTKTSQKTGNLGLPFQINRGKVCKEYYFLEDEFDIWALGTEKLS